MPIIPDAKNWTWVLDEMCPDCGFDAGSLDTSAIGAALRANAAEWPSLLAHQHARLRPTGDQWSALEYGCHVRDVFRLYDERLRLMLRDHDAQFANWDQDVTAVDERYDQQDPAVVAVELVAAAGSLASRFEGVCGDEWQRTGRRSDGVGFTIESFGRYLLHDPVHHLDDVARGNDILAAGSLDS